MHLVAKKKYALPWDPKEYASMPVPTWGEWQDLWQLWDTVSRQMIPDEELLEKPIKLRNACIFYLGHIPTFFDIKITDTTDGVPTHPRYYHQIFERGIDPDVEDPEKCHAHSEIPTQWPPLGEILAYQKRVRERVKKLYDQGVDSDPKVGRCLWLGYEHEAMHLETLLYMLIQSEKTLPPTRVPIPIWKVQSDQAEKSAVPNEWFSIPAREISINLDDPEDASSLPGCFGWDIEKPSRKVQVHRFLAKARPITIGEYAHYILETGRERLPTSWAERQDGHSEANGEIDGEYLNLNASFGIGTKSSLPAGFLANKYVRTVFGAVPLADALTWPVSASYDELAGCAKYMGGRIPTLEEARSIYAYVNGMATTSSQTTSQRLGRTIPAVNGHLVNDGVEESPPSNDQQSSSMGHSGDPSEQFISLKGCNVGFQHWHPTSIVEKGNKLCGQAETGGLWEWTSTPLSKHPGYKPMPLYPAYSRKLCLDRSLSSFYIS